MSTLGRIFTRYYFVILILVILIVVLTANIGSRMFFEQFTLQSRYEQDVTIMNGIRDILYGQYGMLARAYFLNLLASQHRVDVIIRQGGETIFTTEERFLIPEEEVIYSQYPFEDLEVSIGRNQNILLEKVNLQYIRTLNILYLATFAVAALAAFLLSNILSQRMIKPIMQISENINHISMGRYQSLKTPSTRAKELMLISDELEKMACRKASEEKMKQRLSNDIVHELKTPITALAANLEAIHDGIYPPNSERIQILLDQTNRLAKLVHRLSDLTLIEAEAETLEMEKVDLSTLLQDICMMYEAEATEQGVGFFRDIQTGLSVLGNLDRLTQLYVNLLSNAVKYTQKGGTIRVSLEDTDGFAVTSVEDTGIGIDARDLPYVFERLYRADQSRSTRTGGTGIGLAIVRAIVAAHSGEIRIESEPGKGTRVRVFFHKI